MVLLQCYHNITTSYSHHCKEMLRLINIFVHLKAYWSICLWFSLPHLPGAIPTIFLSVLYSWFLKLFNNRIFSPLLNRQSNRPTHLLGIKTQVIPRSGSHISYLFFLPCEAQSDTSFFTGLADSNTLQQLSFAQESCLILQTLALKVYFLTGIKASVWSIIRKLRASWGRAWKTFKHQCCPAVLTLNSQRHHLPRNTCAMSKASTASFTGEQSPASWQTHHRKHVTEPQKVTHRTDLMGFFSQETQHWHSATQVSLKEATRSSRNCLWKSVLGDEERWRGSAECTSDTCSLQ